MPESHTANETRQGEVFLDARGNGRAMRLTWHHEADLVVLSMWRDQVCAGTFRLALTDVNDFIDALVDGLRDAPGVQISQSSISQPAPIEIDHPLPSPQRAVGAHAAAIPETGEVAATIPAQQQESFTDWAFGPSSQAG